MFRFQSGTSGAITTRPGKETKISKKENGKLILDQEALEKVICHPSIGERPISIVTIVGAFRKGKSFLLNFFLRYLRNKGYENENWMGKPEDTIDEGFTWRGGKEGVTSGITIWSEPFIINRQGEEIAILLMDTQGAFDNSSNISECIQVFTISLIMSSLAIFNVQSQIQEDNLHFLEYLTMYLQSVKEKSKQSASETLMFLVRDWVYGEELGLIGGEKYLSDIYSKKESRMSMIQKAFENHIHCYLLPLPGQNVMTSGEKTVQIKEISSEFLEYVGKLSGDIFHPSSKLLKKNKNSGRTLVNIIINSWNIFQALLQPKTLKEMVSKHIAMASQSDVETEYEAFIKKLAVKMTSMGEFERLSIKEQVAALKDYRDKVSGCFKSDVEAGVETLQPKLRQKHDEYLVIVEINQEGKNSEKLISRREFESCYMDECEKILCEDDCAERKLTSLSIVYENSKAGVKKKFSKNKVDKIEREMEICFGVYKTRITLKERSKSAQKAQKCVENLTYVARYPRESTKKSQQSVHAKTTEQEFEDFIKELQLDAHFEKELTEVAKTCVKTGDDICIDPIITKIDMTVLEGNVMDSLHDLLEKTKNGYVITHNIEKAFADIKKRFLESYVEQADKSNQEDNAALPNSFIERHLEREFDFARKINAKNLEYIESDLKMFVSNARLTYMQHMNELCNSAYVTTELLEKENETRQKILFEKFHQLWDELSDATNLVQDHRNILRHELSGIFQELKEVNEKNRTFFHRVVDRFGDKAGISADYEKRMGIDHGVADFFVGATIMLTRMTGTVGLLPKETAIMMYRYAKNKYNKILQQHMANKITSVEQEVNEAEGNQN